MNHDQIALQLYTVREAAREDLLGTLGRVAAIGYRGVEFAGLHGVAAGEVRTALDAHGLRAAAAHVGLGAFAADAGQVIRDLHALGCPCAVVPGTPHDPWASPEGVRALAEQMNRLGGQLRAEGLRLAYHNHAFEFVDLGGQTGWELFAAATDPDLVDLELDVYWADVAGQAPASLIARFAARLPLLHLKDRGPDDDAPLGDGRLDLPGLLDAAVSADVRWLIVEQDNPQDPLNDVARSMAYLAGQIIARSA